MKDSTAIKITAIICITVLDAIALTLFKIDGVLFATAVGAIGTIAGHELRGLKIKKEAEESGG